MILYKPDPIKKIKPYKWFAWYPVWVWTNEEHKDLIVVWLQRVWRTNGFSIKYKYYLKMKDEIESWD